MMITAKELKKEINSIITFIGFDYNGKACGVDPISRTHFDMWYGDNNLTATNIDDVMTAPLFDGKSLEDIANEIDFDI